MADRPNILYLHSHDTGRYVQPYGFDIPTPNIQKLAEQGVLFRQCCCGGPTCSPSRAALLTGQSAHGSGMIGLAHRGFSLSQPNQHLVHTLGAAGYSSALIGVQHVTDWRGGGARKVGYDRVVDLEESWDVDEISGRAREFFEGGADEPFFLSVGFVQTHRGYPEPGPDEDERYCRPPDPMPDTSPTRHDMACYKASARVLDRGMGAVVDALDASGHGEETLVICTTDHGIAFPGMKCHLTDHGIGVMLIMRGPGGFSGGRACDALISQIDLYPTLCELLEIEPPQWLEGTSLMPLIRREAEEVNDAVFSEVTYHAAYEPQRCVRTRRWKYIWRPGESHGGRLKPVLPNCDESPSKDLWMEHGWADREVPEERLYDLVFDPHETHNLANDPDHADVLADMKTRLQKWMEETEDPLLDGPVPAPKGAKVNDPAGASPNEPTITIE
jgi:arylsulfatase A-like enzyme